MEYLLRVKCVSECIGIRRSYVGYIKDKAGSFNLGNTHHPLSKFKLLTLNNNVVDIDGEDRRLAEGDEVYFYKTNKVMSLDKEVDERITLGILKMPLHDVMIKMYQAAIERGESFDQWNGEFEFLIGAIYELCNKDMDNANLYYDKAMAKGFSFGFLEKE